MNCWKKSGIFIRRLLTTTTKLCSKRFTFMQSYTSIYIVINTNIVIYMSTKGQSSNNHRSLSIVKRQHVKVSVRHWSSTNRMSNRQNQFPIGHDPFSHKIGNTQYSLWGKFGQLVQTPHHKYVCSQAELYQVLVDNTKGISDLHSITNGLCSPIMSQTTFWKKYPTPKIILATFTTFGPPLNSLKFSIK